MALFNRNNRTSVPEEIQEYYETERRERKGVAWLLAIGTLIVTILLAVAIFFAGRWVYRQIAGNDDQPTQVAQNDQNQQTPSSSDNSDSNDSNEDRQESSDDSRNTGGTDSQQGSDSTERADESSDGQVDDEAATTDEPASSGGSTDDSADDQAMARTGDDMPATGPEDTLAIFVAVAVLGYLGHRAYLVKSSQK